MCLLMQVLMEAGSGTAVGMGERLLHFCFDICNVLGVCQAVDR